MPDISRADAIKIAAEIDAACASIFEKYGLSKSKGRTTYGDVFAYKIEASLSAPDDAPDGFNPNSPDAKCFAANADYYGLDPALLGTVVTVFGLGEARLVGLNPRSRRYPILATRVTDGKTYKVSAEAIRVLATATAPESH